MTTKELKGKTEIELKAFLDKEREKLAQFKFNIISGKVKNVKEATALRKNIARIMTILNNKK